MANQPEIKTAVWKDIIWYLLGAAVPMFVYVIKTPIFTSHYTPADFGYYGLVLSVFMYGSTVIYAWILSCIWRYFHHFDKRNRKSEFYTNILTLFVFSSLVMLLFSGVLLTIFNDPQLVWNLIFISFFYFLTKEFLALYQVLIRIKGKAKQNNLIQIIQAVFSFGVLCLLAFEYDFDITAMLISSIIIDVLLILIVGFFTLKSGALKHLSFKFISKRWMKIFLRFGSMTLWMSLLLMMIKSVDRYIITLYDSIENVGIYTKVFDVAQMMITAIIFVFFSAINPAMNQKLTYDLENADHLIKKYVFAFLVVGYPFIMLACLFSSTIADILLGEDFRIGYQIMPYVFIGAFLYGFVIFVENKLQFKNQLPYILKVLTICLGLNVILNFIFVPYYGYHAAAVISMFTFISMTILFYKKEHLHLFSLEGLKSYLTKTFILSVTIILIHFWMQHNLEFKLIHTILEGVVILLLYMLINFKNLKMVKETLA